MTTRANLLGNCQMIEGMIGTLLKYPENYVSFQAKDPERIEWTTEDGVDMHHRCMPYGGSMMIRSEGDMLIPSQLKELAKEICHRLEVKMKELVDFSTDILSDQCGVIWLGRRVEIPVDVHIYEIPLDGNLHSAQLMTIWDRFKLVYVLPISFHSCNEDEVENITRQMITDDKE